MYLKVALEIFKKKERKKKRNFLLFPTFPLFSLLGLVLYPQASSTVSRFWASPA
jgi:hypothetical protein